MITRRGLLATGASFATLALSGRAMAAENLASGTFKGESRHVTTGTATIVKDGDKTYVTLGSDFTFDGAPDPKVALGANGYDPSTLLSALRNNTGAQSYEIPASIDQSRYNEVWIWCERFNVPLGVAKLSR